MHNRFFIGDTHFGHRNIITFLKDDGSKLRDFSSTEEMDEHMVECWNKVVRPVDRVYHLGDVVINRKALPILSRLNGRKKLIRGNHDIFKLADYTPYFEDVYGVYVLKDMILSHIPLHPECITTRFGTNVHGHLHSNRIRMTTGLLHMVDPRYFSVCTEKIDYTPIEHSELVLKIQGQRDAYQKFTG